MILYIHGFGSSAQGTKAREFGTYFKSRGEKFIAPSLSHIPDLAISTLESIIEVCEEEIKIIGSSLGGFYALYLSQKYNLKAILINPAVHADLTLKRAIGHGVSYYDNSMYEWNDLHVSSLSRYKVKNPDQNRIMLLLQKGDDLLDFREAVAFLSEAYHYVEEGGTHNFDGIQRYFEKISEF
jgi:uncharacterized protein